MSEDIKDIIEILELAKEEIENNDENIIATLDLQDLKSLKNLYDLYKEEKEKNKELEKQMGKDLDVVYLKAIYDERDKWKDKIRKKIEYYNDKRISAETEKINDMFVNYIDVLEELLEEV